MGRKITKTGVYGGFKEGLNPRYAQKSGGKQRQAEYKGGKQ